MCVGGGGATAKCHIKYSAQQNSTDNGEAKRTVGCWIWSCCGGERCSGSEVAVVALAVLVLAVLVLEGRRRRMGSGEGDGRVLL